MTGPGSGDRSAPGLARDRVGWAEQVADDPVRAERRFDAWAEFYDQDVAEQYDWQGPLAAAGVIERHVAPSARLLDAGAGTGLVGEILAARGFKNLEASDISQKMLDVAAAKDIYSALYKADLNAPIALDSACFDAVVAVGISGYVRGHVLEEFMRILRPGGKCIFTISDQCYRDDGYRQAVDRLVAAGAAEVIEVGEEFPPIPKSQPGHLARIRVLQKPL